MPTLYIRNRDNTDWIEIGGTPGGGSPPSDLYGVPYVTMGNSSVTTAERALTAGAGIVIADWGANALVVVSCNWGAVPSTIEPDDAAAPGAGTTVARIDHVHAIVAATAGTIEPDDAAAEGVATSFSRSDHQHAIVAAVPVDIANANAEGAATSFARSNHVHNHPAALGTDLHHTEAHVVNSTGPHAEAMLTIGHVLRASGAAAFSFAAIQAGDLPGLGGVPALTFGLANAAGAAATYVQTDASLAIFDAVVPTTIQPDDAAAAGVAAFAARRDHTHAIVCAAPASPSVDLNASAEGAGTSFARADHTHQLDQGIAPTWTQLHTFNLGLTVAAAQAITMGHLATIGQVAGPLITFNDTTNVLGVTGCSVGIEMGSPPGKFSVQAAAGITAYFVSTAGGGAGAGIAAVTDDGAATTSGNRLGYFLFGGAIDALNNRQLTAGLSSWATENWGVGNEGSDFRFEVTANGAAARSEAMRIDHTGYIGFGTTDPDCLTHAEASDAVTDAVTYVQRLSHITSGTAVANFGVGLEFELEENDGTNRVAAAIDARWSDAGEGVNADGYLAFKAMLNDAAAVDRLLVGYEGAMRYGDIAGGNYLAISSGGVCTLVGTAKRTLTMRADIDHAVVSAHGKPTSVTIGAFQGFSLPIHGANEELFLSHTVPGRWDGASDITIHILAALSGAEDVGDKFNLQISWNHLTEGNVVPAATHDVPVEQAVLAGRNAQYDTYMLEFTLDYDVDTPDDVVSHDLLAMRLRRLDATDPDVTHEIIILDWHLEYTVDKMFHA